MKVGYLSLAAVTLMSAGCSSFSGLSGSKSELACKAPDGVICTSVSGIYANSLAEALPGQQQPKSQDKPSQDAGSKDPRDDATMPPPAYFSPRDLATPNSGDPIRMAPLVLRVWIAPWEDTEGDLHDQHYLYTVVHQGKWLIETNQQQIRDAYKPVFPLRGQEKPEEKRAEAAGSMPGVSVQGGGNP